MAHLLKRGDTFFVRLTIPRDRWADVGKAMGAATGIRREVVRTLQTGDHREAQRRRDEGLNACRQAVDAALRKGGYAPLTDWTATWAERAVERRAQMQSGADTVNQWIEDGEGSYALMEAELTADVIEQEAGRLAVLRGPEAARQFEQIAFGTGMSVAEAGRQWIASIRGAVREGTWQGYEASIKRLGAYLATREGVPSLEAAGLSSVTRRMAGEVIADRRAGRASETVQRDFSAWNGLWRWAVRRGYADLNPWTDQTAGLKAPRLGETEGTKRAYTTAELVTLLRAECDTLAPNNGGFGPALWDLIRLGLLTGARASELAGLCIGDVIEGGTAIATPKLGKSASAARIIPLHRLAQSVLASRLASLPNQAADAPLWPEVPGAGADERRAKTLSTRFIIVRRRLLGADDGADLHSLRRNFMTACETAQHAGGRISPEITALLVGHKRGSMALDLYSEWSRMGRRTIGGGMAEKLATLRDALDDAVDMGFPPDVLRALTETQGARPPTVRTKPAFSRKG